MIDYSNTNQVLTLDPPNTAPMRQLAHQMVDDMFDYVSNLRQQPVWQPVPETTKQLAQESLPLKGQPAELVYESFKQHIMPYAMKTVHPRFWAYAGGSGSYLAMMADMLAAGLNANVTNGDHASMYIDHQVVEWSKEMLGFPKTGGGMLVSGCSIANITALIVARNAFNKNIRSEGVVPKLIVYTSQETHCSIQKAVEIIGIGSAGLRIIPTNKDFQIDMNALKLQIAIDKKEGYSPFCIVGTVGTVSTGAIDPLDELAALCKKENYWFHIDGAFGALAKLAPTYQTPLKAIELADSVAFDFHKWMYIPYEVGCILFKNKELQRNSFTVAPPYLLAHERGLASGPEGLTNYGIELSRGFKALKVWMSLKEHGIEKFSQLIQQNINHILYLETLVHQTPELEMLAPVTLNIACFRYKPLNHDLSVAALNHLNKEILMQLHEQGLALPSYTFLEGNYAIRVANLNHRSTAADFEALVADTVRLGAKIVQKISQKQAEIVI
jgi:glutamate/tyrosine decarboxylase-like PLP-dependent enzyme